MPWSSPRRFATPFLPVVATSLAILACGKPAPRRAPDVPVTIAVAEQRSAPYVLSANGVVEPRQTAAIQSQVTGLLTDVHFREGDEVRAGQLLFQIDPRPYQNALAQARAILARDEAQLASAQRDADRFGSLAEQDYVTRQQAEQSLSTATALRGTVAADSSAIASARLNLDYATIRAPISGRTGSLLLREGNLVRTNTAQPLVVINQIHPILVRFSIPENTFPDLQRYGAGQRLPVRVTLPTGSLMEAGRLSFIDNAVDTTTGTVMLKAEFPNEDGRLWPGQFVGVQLQLFVQKNAIVVPAEAVLTGQTGNYVYVVDAEGKARSQAVEVGRTLSDSVVIDRGLASGARVVTDGQSRLTPGATVTIKPNGAGTRRAGARGGDTTKDIAVEVAP
jgi:membrane fusion protein, multidrug efflux system